MRGGWWLILNASLLFLREDIADEILDLLPIQFNGEQSADDTRYQDLKNITASARVQIGESILEKQYLHNDG